MNAEPSPAAGDVPIERALAAARTNCALCRSGHPDECAAAKAAVDAVLTLCREAVAPGDRLHAEFGFRGTPPRVSVARVRAAIAEAGVR